MDAHDLLLLQGLSRAADEQLSRGEVAAAVAILAPTMNGLDPTRTPASPETVWAATTWSRTARTADTARERLGWAEFAHTHARTVYGSAGDPRCLVIATVLANVYDGCGRHDEALDLRDTVVAGWTALGYESTIAATAGERAQTLHRRGSCGDAVHQITATLGRWRPHHDLLPTLGEAVISVAVRLLVCCDRDDEVAVLLANNTTLLPPIGTPRRRNMATTILTTVDTEIGDHDLVCARHDEITVSTTPQTAVTTAAAVTSAAAADVAWQQRRLDLQNVLLGRADDAEHPGRQIGTRLPRGQGRHDPEGPR